MEKCCNSAKKTTKKDCDWIGVFEKEHTILTQAHEHAHKRTKKQQQKQIAKK